MEWLTENWFWILLGIGLVWLFFKGRTGMGCCGGGDSHDTQEGEPKKEGEEQVTSRRGGCH